MKLETTVLIRISLELKQELQKLADKDSRKLADFCRLKLEDIAFKKKKNGK